MHVRGSTQQANTVVHRVGRVQSFFSSRHWDSPNPSPAGECDPPLIPWGGARSLAREGVGHWESPNSDERTYTVLLCKYMYFVL
jgi:hypothetical protein